MTTCFLFSALTVCFHFHRYYSLIVLSGFVVEERSMFLLVMPVRGVPELPVRQKIQQFLCHVSIIDWRVSLIR